MPLPTKDFSVYCPPRSELGGLTKYFVSEIVKDEIIINVTGVVGNEVTCNDVSYLSFDVAMYNFDREMSEFSV